MTINTQDPSNSSQLNPIIDTSTETTAQPESAFVAPKSQFQTKDTSEASEETAPPPDYQKSSSKPGLPPPIVSTGSVEEANIAQLYDSTQFIEYLKSSDTETSPASQQQKEEWAKVKVDDPELVAFAEKLGMSGGELQAKLQVSQGVYFKQMIKDLPEEQQNKLNFAHNNPESAGSLSPELKALFDKINQGITNTIIADSVIVNADGVEIGLPKDWGGVKPEGSYFNDNLTIEFSDAFVSKISDMKMGEQITAKQALNLRAMHYMPGSFANDPTLQALFKEVEGSVVADLQTKYGTGVDWAPKADTGYLTQVANGYFRVNFQTQLDAFNPPLTEVQKQEIMQLFVNPGTLPSTEEIGRIAKTFTGVALAATIEKFGLDSAWMPSTSPILNVSGVSNPTLQMGIDTFNTAKSLFDKFSAMATGLPEGPTKTAYLDYLKTIGETLNKLQELLYSLSSTDTNTSKKLARANMETTLDDIKKSEEAVKAAKDLEEDTKKLDLSPLGDINDWIGQLVTIVMAVACGPIFLIIALAYLIDKCVAEENGTPSIASQAMADVNTAGGTTEGGAFLTGFVALVLGGGNPMVTLNVMNDAKTIQNLVKSMGGDEMAQEVTAAVFGAVVQIVMMVAMMAATGGAAAPAVFATITSSIAKFTKLSVETVTTALKIINITFTVAMGALQATQQGLQANWEFVQAEIKTILSTAEANSEEVKALIATLRKLIDKLLAALEGTSEEILMISKVQGKKWTDASATTSEIQG